MSKDSTSYCRVCGALENEQAMTGDFLPYVCPDCQTLEAAMEPGVAETINSLPYREMLRLNRVTPAGEGYFAHRETGEYFAKVMAWKGREIGPAACVAASKSVGW